MILEDTLARNNVTIIGTGTKTLVLAHGFGCDQTMWHLLTPYLEHDFRIVLFDYVGSGKSDPRAFKGEKYSKLDGYAQDIIDVCETLNLSDVTLIGHSVSCMTGLIAAIEAPQIISKLIMVCPSPYFLNDPPDYQGGFERADLEELLGLMDKNYVGWANHLAPIIMGLSGTDKIDELADSFCSTDPLFAKTFARVTFFSDCRDRLSKANQPTLIFQSTNDRLAPVSIGEFVQANMISAELEVIEANGHCLHMTHHRQIAPALVRFALG